VDLEFFAKDFEFRRKLGSGRQRLATGMGNSWQTVPRFLKVDCQLAFLIGLYVAEGCVTGDANSLRTYLSLHRNEEELIGRAKAILAGYGIKYHEYNEKSTQTHQIRVSGQIWGTFIREMTGGGSLMARLPWFMVFWHNRNVRKALLSGVLNGDGSFSTQGSFEFYTVSSALQQQVIYLLRSFDLSPTLNRSRNPPMIRVAGGKTRSFLESILLDAKLRKLKHYTTTHAGPLRGRHVGTRNPTIRKVRPNGAEHVYSLDVHGTHNFFTTSGWLVHNCIPLSSKYVLEGAEKPEKLTILKETISTDSAMPSIIADKVADSGIKHAAILGLSYKGDLKVHVLSPTLRITKRLVERGVQVKINDPYYTPDEIRRLTGADSFNFPEGLSDFECILIVAGHRLYKAVPEKSLKAYLKNCRLIIDNLEETWKHFDWESTEIKYLVAGDSGWLG
jgi:hypothetical protein